MNTNKLSKNNSPFRLLIDTWLPTFFWIIVVCYLSLADSGLPNIKFRFILESDKIAHIGIYSVLTLLFIRSLVKAMLVKSIGNKLLISSLLAISFSIVMEVLQKTLTKTRQFDLHDIYANFTGVIIGVIIFILFKRFFLRSKSDFNA